MTRAADADKAAESLLQTPNSDFDDNLDDAEDKAGNLKNGSYASPPKSLLVPRLHHILDFRMEAAGLPNSMHSRIGSREVYI